MNREPSPPVLNMTGIFKRFGPTIALENVNFKLRKGEVHALLGENGAGKSTLVKILSGALKPDKGKMFINGQPFIPSGPMDSRMKGISMIYQELNLAPHLTVEENIMLGKEIHKTGFLKQGKMRDKVVKALEILQHPGIRPDITVGRLGIGAKQIVEIARALVDQAFILIMDEPTSSLSREDSERLFQIIGNLKSQGVSIIYISHFLEEVQHVADRFTVLRDGRQVDSGSMKDVELDDIIQMMVGKKMADMFPCVDHQVGEPVLRLEGFRGKSMKEDVNFSLRRGEIFGVAGLIGAGRTEMLRSIFGLEAVIEGTLSIEGVKRKKSRPWIRIKQGMGLLSEDRQEEGLALSLSIKDNVTLSHFSPYCVYGFLNLKKQKTAVNKYCRLMNVKTIDTDQPVLVLSGGNQQKIAMARLLHQEADILLMDEPTRGIDVVSKSQIYEWMGTLASRGKAIIFVSSYIPELLGICDRIAVFYRGKMKDVRSTEEWTIESLTAAVTLGRSEHSLENR